MTEKLFDHESVMDFEWDEQSRARSTLAKHGIDFDGCMSKFFTATVVVRRLGSRNGEDALRSPLGPSEKPMKSLSCLRPTSNVMLDYLGTPREEK